MGGAGHAGAPLYARPVGPVNARITEGTWGGRKRNLGEPREVVKEGLSGGGRLTYTPARQSATPRRSAGPHLEDTSACRSRPGPSSGSSGFRCVAGVTRAA